MGILKNRSRNPRNGKWAVEESKQLENLEQAFDAAPQGADRYVVLANRADLDVPKQTVRAADTFH